MDWSNSVVTKAGESIYKKLDKGVGASVVRAEAGTGVYPESIVREQAALLDKKQNITVVDAREEKEGRRIHLRIENKGLAAGYKMQQVGIWMAVDGGEPVLFSIQQDDDGVDIPSEEEIEEFVLDFYVMLAYSGRLNVQVQCDPQAAASVEQLQLLRQEVPELIVGPASMAERMMGAGILFITDEADPEDYAIPLRSLLAEGDRAYAGETDDLGELLTAGRAAALRLRKDSLGTEYAQEDLDALAQAIRGVCTKAQSGGRYVMNGATAVSARQVQYFILHGELVSHSDTLGEEWPWLQTPESGAAEVATLRAEVAELRALLGDLSAALGEVLDGEGGSGDGQE